MKSSPKEKDDGKKGIIHMKDRTRRFRCHKCCEEVILCGADEFMDHLMKVHDVKNLGNNANNIKDFFCEHCDEEFFMFDGLLTHMIHSHGIKCEIYSFVTTAKTESCPAKSDETNKVVNGGSLRFKIKLANKNKGNKKKSNKKNKKTSEDDNANGDMNFSDEDPDVNAIQNNISQQVSQITDANVEESKVPISVLTQPDASREDFVQVAEMNDNLFALDPKTGYLTEVSTAEVYRNCDVNYQNISFENGDNGIIEIPIDGNGDNELKTEEESEHVIDTGLSELLQNVQQDENQSRNKNTCK